MAEGLFAPDQIATPFGHERVLRALVRTRTPIYFLVTLFATEREAAAFRAALGLPIGYQKVNLPEGVILWHLVFDVAGLDAVRHDPGRRLQPALYEAIEALADAPAPPVQRVAAMEGQGGGFFIAADGRLLTNYHIAREEIDPAGRVAGAADAHRCRYLSFATLELADGVVAGYRPLPDVDLLVNLSAADWKAGWDAALLRAAGPAPAYLEVAPELPAVGEEVWAYGFPMRSRCPSERLAALGYRDADHSPRVAHGRISEGLTDHTFVADLDGLSGSSGGPVLDRRGRVVGLVQDVYPPSERERRPLHFAGGMACVAARPALWRLLERQGG